MKTSIAALALVAATGLGSVAYAQTAQPGTALPGGTSNPRQGLPTTTPNATAGEAAAKSQLEAKGYSGVKQLTRDTAGNWSGKAMRNNVEIAVTLDAAGNVIER
jgi:hypothetical protein